MNRNRPAYTQSAPSPASEHGSADANDETGQSSAEGKVLNICLEGAECSVALESNHRIANHMGMLAGYVRLMRGDVSGRTEAPEMSEVLRLFDAISAQVAAVSELHRMLSSSASLSSGDIGSHVGRICAAFRNGPACGAFIHYTGEQNCILPVRHILPVSQIVSEIITNALKHGHRSGEAGSIRVGCRRESESRVAISIDDDGEGLPSTAVTPRQEGVGVRLIAGLARQVDGTIVYQSSRAGLSFTLSLPADVPSLAKPPLCNPGQRAGA